MDNNDMFLVGVYDKSAIIDGNVLESIVCFDPYIVRAEKVYEVLQESMSETDLYDNIFDIHGNISEEYKRIIDGMMQETKDDPHNMPVVEVMEGHSIWIKYMNMDMVEENGVA